MTYVPWTYPGDPADPRGEVTRLLSSCSNGNRAAFDELIPLVYDDLRRIAHRRLRDERAGHTLSTTAVVHEAYLQLAQENHPRHGPRHVRRASSAGGSTISRDDNAMTHKRTLDLGGRIVAALTLSAACLQAGLLAAQEATPAAAAVSDNTIVARVEIDPAVLEDVTNARDLVMALRQHLTITSSMPLDEPLIVVLTATIGRSIRGVPYILQISDLAIRIPAGGSVSGRFGDALVSSHGPWSEFQDEDWSEDRAWQALEKALDTALPLPQMEGAFAANSDGHVPFRVVAVHQASWNDYELDERLERIRLRLDPKPSFGSSSMAGWKEPAGFGYQVEVLLIELEPGPPDMPPDAGALSAADTEILEVSKGLLFSCDAQALGRAVNSVSVVDHAGQQIIGQAAAGIRDDVFILSLGTMEEGARSCLVLLSPGGMVDPGRYEVVQLSPTLSEPGEGAERFFVAAMASGADGKTTFVTDSGSIEIFIRTAGQIEGRFQLAGWMMRGDQRTDGVTLTGSFNAKGGAQ